MIIVNDGLHCSTEVVGDGLLSMVLKYLLTCPFNTSAPNQRDSVLQ